MYVKNTKYRPYLSAKSVAWSGCDTLRKHVRAALFRVSLMTCVGNILFGAWTAKKLRLSVFQI